MFCARTTTFLLVLSLLCVSLVAQQRRKLTAAKPKPAATTPAPKPTTLLACGVAMRVPPGWEVSLAKAPEAAQSVAKTPTAPEPESKQDEPPTPPAPDDKTAVKAAAPATESSTPEMPRCSFVAAPKAPSALVKNTETVGPVGQMELRVMDGDLDTAAAVLFQKDEKGWYALDSKGTRTDAKLTKQKTMQILSGVIVQRCYDRSGQSRGLCEVSKYVYSNGRKNLLVTAGPYIGETEYVILNSVRFVPATTTTRTRAKH
jgi:hypothetical protein